MTQSPDRAAFAEILPFMLGSFNHALVFAVMAVPLTHLEKGLQGRP
jgi:hypothetical protein